MGTSLGVMGVLAENEIWFRFDICRPVDLFYVTSNWKDTHYNRLRQYYIGLMVFIKFSKREGKTVDLIITWIQRERTLSMWY